MSYSAICEGHFDASGLMGDLFRPREGERPEWPMYSYSRPAYMVWNVIGQVMTDKGITEEKIKNWLQSTGPRHCLDGSLGDALREAAEAWAKKNFLSELSE